MARSRGTPFLVNEQNERTPLERVLLGSGNHDEGWLQELIHEQPGILPVNRIEPGFGSVISVAREVPCGHGYIDNLLLTPSGDIVMVEAKLWANPQARREVVAQALDYVSALTLMGYERFEEAVGKGKGAGARLYEAISEHPEALGEDEFVDAVSRNLSRGRILVMVAGDGIRREAESLAGLLQGHAGAHFTLALIELATWKNVRTGDILVVPDILAQTVMIERGIVRLAGADMKVDEPASVSESRTGTISEELFFEELGSKIPDAPQLVRTFLDLVEPLGVKPELLASLNLKVDLPGSDRPTNFGYITKAGKVWIDTFSWTAPAHVALEYNEAIAAMFNGEVKTYPTGSLTATTNGSSAPLVTDLLPQHAQDWAKAIAKAIEQIHAFERERDSD